MNVGKILLSCLLLLAVSAVDASAEAIRSGTYRGVLRLDEQFSDSVDMPRSILFIARVTKSGNVITLKNQRGNTYRLNVNPLSPSQYLGSTRATIHAPQGNACTPDGKPTLLVVQKGRNALEVHQTIKFDGCLDADAMPFEIGYQYAGKLRSSFR